MLQLYKSLLFHETQCSKQLHSTCMSNQGHGVQVLNNDNPILPSKGIMNRTITQIMITRSRDE